MTERSNVIWELTRACELNCRHCPHPEDRVRSRKELSTYEAYTLVNQVAELAPERFVISGGDPLERDDVYQLVDHARRRGLKPAVTLSPTSNVTEESIARLRRNGVRSVIVSLDDATAERHDSFTGLKGSFAHTVRIMTMVLRAGVDVEVNTLVRHGNLATLGALYERIEQLGVTSWNLYFLVPASGCRSTDLITAVEASWVSTMAETLRPRGLMEIRLMESPFADGGQTIFVTSEGYVRGGEFLSVNAGDLRSHGLLTILRRSEVLRQLRSTP